MNEAFLQNFLNGNIRVKWNTQDELEYMADVVDQYTGVESDRTYMRGYLPSQYGYWGISDTFNERYVLWKRSPNETYNPEEFILALNGQDEQNIDISDML